MSKIIRNAAIAFVAITTIALGGDCCSAQMLSDGCDLHRSQLIPYHTAAAAKERSMERQRYMQPITEWSRGADGGFEGEFTFPFSWLERQVFLRVEATGRGYEVLLNGKRVGLAANGYVATEFNITKQSREDKNRVELRFLEDNPMAPIECFGGVIAESPVAYIISQPRVRVCSTSPSACRCVCSRARGGSKDSCTSSSHTLYTRHCSAPLQHPIAEASQGVTASRARDP